MNTEPESEAPADGGGRSLFSLGDYARIALAGGSDASPPFRHPRWALEHMKSILLFLLALACAMGCNRKSGDFQIAVDQSRASKVYTEAELRTLIAPGMTIAEVTNRFGSPGSAVKLGRNAVLLTYMFPFEAKEQQGPYLTGFGIDIKDGLVVRWSPITGMTGKTLEPGGSQGSFGEQSFQLVLAEDSLTNLANAVISNGSADASSLKASPTLAFKAKVFAGRSGDEPPGEQTVILVVSEADASKLKDLSQQNLGKRFLIVCRKKVVAAPAISGPLASRQLMFRVKSRIALETIEGK